MKKKAKQLLVAVFFGVILLTSTLALALNANTNTNTDTDIDTTDTTPTGTPADNYPIDKRVTFCGTNSTKSNRYITEFNVPTFCARPLAITTDPSGNVWFTESNTGNIAKFDPFSRTFTEYQNERWPKGDQSMMWGMAYAPDGNIWFTDEFHDVMWKFDKNNFTSFQYPKSEAGETFPQRIVIDGQKLLVNDFIGNKITFFDYTQSGQEIPYSKVNSQTSDTLTASLTVDSDKKIWYTVWKFQQGGSLVRYDPQTSNGTAFNLPYGMFAPNGISSGPENKIWITDAASSFFFSFDKQSEQFTRFTTSIPRESTYGNSSGLIKTPISRPYWNQFDNTGRLWFNEQTGNSIAVFDPTKETLVEYFIPSQNPNWSDCSGIKECGVAQVLDFTINNDKIWFTEWVENNIAVLDSSILLPIEVNVDKKNLTMSRAENSTILFTITPKEQLVEPITLTTANTSTLNDIKVASENQITIGDKPETVPFTVSVDRFALSGTYKILLGARYQEVTISQYVTVTVK